MGAAGPGHLKGSGLHAGLLPGCWLYRWADVGHWQGGCTDACLLLTVPECSAAQLAVQTTATSTPHLAGP